MDLWVEHSVVVEVKSVEAVAPIHDRRGKLVAQAIDMRTEKQFLEMLAQAGLE